MSWCSFSSFTILIAIDSLFENLKHQQHGRRHSIDCVSSSTLPDHGKSLFTGSVLLSGRKIAHNTECASTVQNVQRVDWFQAIFFKVDSKLIHDIRWVNMADKQYTKLTCKLTMFPWFSNRNQVSMQKTLHCVCLLNDMNWNKCHFVPKLIGQVPLQPTHYQLDKHRQNVIIASQSLSVCNWNSW